MSTVPLLGLAGYAGAGKTFIADICHEKFELFPWGFANPLKMRVYAMTDEWSFDQYFDDKPYELRRLLQIEGTENSREKYRSDFWLRQLEAFCYILDNYWDVEGLTLCDLRFPNEVEFIKDRGGIVLKVIGNKEVLEGDAKNHSSEQYIDKLDVDGIIDNSEFPSRENLIEQLTPYVSLLKENKQT